MRRLVHGQYGLGAEHAMPQGPAPAGMNMTEAHSPLESACILPITSSSDPTSTCRPAAAAERLQRTHTSNISNQVLHRH